VRKLKSGLLLLAVSLGCAAPLRAQEVPDSLSFKVGLGELDLTFADRSNRTFQAQMAFLDFGVTKTFGRLFITFNTELPFNQGGDMDQNSGTQLVTQLESYDLALGYSFVNRLSVFGGWHHAKYNFLRSGSQSSMSETRDNGPFVGIGYGVQVGKGTLALSVARGRFDTELVSPPPSITVTNTPATTSGNSYALTWTSEFRHELSYYVRFRQLDYNFTVDPEFQSATLRNTGEKKISMLSIGIIF
jgi:hypothetical protein